MTKKNLQKLIHAIAQEGAAVPTGMVFDPYATPPLFTRESDSSQKATDAEETKEGDTVEGEEMSSE